MTPRYAPEFDYVLVGAHGQIGRALYRELSKRGKVHVCLRGDTDRLPSARNVINAAGYTKFSRNYERIWEDNVVLTATLADQTDRMDAAWFHQLSSLSVAGPDRGSGPMMESSVTRPRIRNDMSVYSQSKVVSETLTAQVSHRYSIVRISDVVPDPAYMVRDFRSDHWLAILFRGGFDPTDSYPVWLARADEVATAIAIIVDERVKGVHHVLGERYTFGELAEGTKRLVPSLQDARRAQRMMDYIRVQPPLADRIDTWRTKVLLESRKFHWTRMDRSYWKEFAATARRRTD